MTSKVTIEAQSHDAEVRLVPVVSGRELWETCSAETRRFATFVVPKGEVREFSIHSGQSVHVSEVRPND